MGPDREWLFLLHGWGSLNGNMYWIWIVLCITESKFEVLTYLILTHSVVSLSPAHPPLTLGFVGLEFSFHQGNSCQTRGPGKKVNDIQLLAATSLGHYGPGSSPVIFFHATTQSPRTFSTFMIFPPATMFAAFFLGLHLTKTTFLGTIFSVPVLLHRSQSPWFY